MDGKDSDMFNYFKNLLFSGIMELRKYVEELVTILQIMCVDSDLPCFQDFSIEVFRGRFKETLTEREFE
jgi:phosphatidylinositol 4-kinase